MTPNNQPPTRPYNGCIEVLNTPLFLFSTPLSAANRFFSSKHPTNPNEEIPSDMKNRRKHQKKKKGHFVNPKKGNEK